MQREDNPRSATSGNGQASDQAQYAQSTTQYGVNQTGLRSHSPLGAARDSQTSYNFQNQKEQQYE